MTRKQLFQIGIAFMVLSLPGCTTERIVSGAPAVAIVLVLALLLIPTVLALKKSGRIPKVTDLLPDLRFNQKNITHTFIAALPTLTREMNLEVASSKQTEVLERSDAKRFLGLDLGTNHARMTVPVTYRYYIRLYDAWDLRIGGTTLLVCAPLIRCSLPPAIHTDEIQERASRGWARGSPSDLLEELRRDLTPVLSEFANDPRRLDLVRDTCRQSVAEFVRRWLENEGRWGQGKFTAICVKIAGEPTLPSNPTLHLDFPPNKTKAAP